MFQRLTIVTAAPRRSTSLMLARGSKIRPFSVQNTSNCTRTAPKPQAQNIHVGECGGFVGVLCLKPSSATHRINPNLFPSHPRNTTILHQNCPFSFPYFIPHPSSLIPHPLLQETQWR
jgi:hypothetical protein